MNGRRIGAKGLAEKLPEFTGRHAKLDALQISRGLDWLVWLQVHVARAGIFRR